MSIPKIIHYCWFGKSELPELAQKCINSWKKYCPDYEIIEWNEDNFDLMSNIYVKEAYEAKKWAFITDYVRLFVLYNYGGVYMDTDVEIIRNIDAFLGDKAFSGFESNGFIPTGIMASEKEGKWAKLMLSYYDNRHFKLPDGGLDLTTNVVTITNLTKENYEITLDNTLQVTNGDVVFYPSDYFCPKDFKTGKINITPNTYTIHHFSGSWHTEEEKSVIRHRQKIKRIFGEKIGNYILSAEWIFCEKGVKWFLKKIYMKIFKRGC